ncbi:magnesium transporter [Methanococcoides methylutens]|uniref:Mg/Co/Ni transporter MgtE n=1 Tax=Methanococcoides methylutens MM1 TaxID=1434104 RepID=A0A0E3SS15_METMT|nr:magnesium transporter [Methanococcoides methylutens]AKB85107.1 Mg/Co/Ni transporter MgtE [Methanococcoides methylutens MM1]
MSHSSHAEEDDDVEIEEEYLGDYASVRSIVKEALPFQLIATLGGAVAGLILTGMTEELELIPGLIVIYPAVLGMRGNISCTLGSRLGSAIHMGLITKIERNPELTNNILGSLILGFILSIVLGILGHGMTALLGLESAGVISLTLIAVLAGVSSGLILAVIAVFLALGMFRFGFDPDNVVTPAIATIGDIVSMFMLLMAAKVVLML